MNCKQMILATSFLLAGCGDVDTETNIIVENDSAVLAKRVSSDNSSISVISPPSKISMAPNTSHPALTLVAKVAAPVHAGKILQATETRILGNRAYVGYNSQGETFLGGIDIFDISNASSPLLVSNIIFTDTDINGLTVHGNTLYAAAATERSGFNSPAILIRIGLSGGLLTDNISELDIKSWAATDVDLTSTHIYVTSGADDGYISVIDKNSFLVIEETALHDARGVDTGSNDIAIVSGADSAGSSGAQLYLYDKSLASLQNTYSITGGNIPFSKSTVELKGAVAVLGMGDGGVQLVCTTDGSVIDTIPQPVLTGVNSTLTVSNAVTAFKRNLFVSNGEAGVYLSRASNVINNMDCNVGTLNLLGKLSFAGSESVNHVVYRANTLFVAAGAGGLKIVQVEDIDTDVSDNDDSP